MDAFDDRNSSSLDAIIMWLYNNYIDSEIIDLEKEISPIITKDTPTIHYTIVYTLVYGMTWSALRYRARAY